MNASDMRNLFRHLLFCCLVLAPVCGLRAGAVRSPYPFGFYCPEGLKECRYPVYTAVQDSSRFIWLGSESGLLKYDGYGILSYRFSPDDIHSLCNDHVNSLVYCHDYGKMVVGTDAGVSVYDFASDTFSRLEACGYMQVKALLRDGNMLWVGTAEGLMRFDISDGLHPGMEPDESARIPDAYIACARKTGDTVCFGTYDGFYTYGSGTGFVMHGLGTVRKLVLDIVPVQDDGSSLWLGTESGLARYAPGRGVTAAYLENIPIKNFLAGDDGRLWIGTDNGLFIKSGDGIVRFGHEAQNSSSLPDNVVWQVFRDSEDDIFLCTDYGIALPRLSPDRTFVPVSLITGSRDGLNIGVMSYDSCGNLWLGGMNGLVMQESDGMSGRWYRADTGIPGMRLSHNKIRDLHADGGGMLAVSDGGLDRIDCRTGRVRHFDIAGRSGEYLSTWMYSVAEDARGRLWLGTYDGLLMIADKDRLLSQERAPYIADAQYNLATWPALSGNATMDIAFTESFGAAISNGSVDFIDTGSDSISYVDLPSDLYAIALAADAGRIWIGTSKGLFCLSRDGKAVRTEGFSLPAESLAVSGDDIFVASGSNVYVYDMSDGGWTTASFSDSPLFCGIPGKEGTVLLGTADGYFIFDRAKMQGPRRREVSVTALFLDNVRIRAGQEYDGNTILEKSLDLTDGIDLKYSQNSFALEYSAFDFSGGGGRFVYRLAGLDDNWQLTDENRAVFINVPGGRYVFEVALATADGLLASDVVSLPVRVRPVWYASPLAYIAYLLLAAGICASVVYYVRMRHQLQIEHLERDRALKTADMKTEFLANVSHEFKSPLSIILGFVGRMLSSEPDAMRSRELNTIRQNAEKIHLLLDQMVQFNENGGTTLFIPTATSLQELARSVYDRYADAFAQKGINSRFVADDIGYVFMVDRLKMESVLQNLLSNALKFTPSGGSVLMSVSVGEETRDMVYADIKVEDTGCGMTQDELPMIFNRYYRAVSGQKDNYGGSGIGLALVKEIVGMHKGKVWAASEPGKGTVFTVRLSTMKADSFVLKSAGREEYSLHSLSRVWQHDRKPVILLVEDNADIRDFIAVSLGKDYVFLLADEGQAGLDLLSKEKIDLVITDIAMPEGMDGLAMSRAIRNSLETAFLPIIILTGRNDEQTEIRSFEYADAFISKPFSLNYLNNRIIQLLIKHELYLSRIRQQKMLETETVDNERSYDEKLLQDVVEIVSRHLEDPHFSAAALCEESRYGSKQIYRRIKQLTGMSIVEFIRDTRLRKAALYLAQGKLSVTEVMYKVGFTTASYFAKCFKEKYGVSPSEYGG